MNGSFRHCDGTKIAPIFKFLSFYFMSYDWMPGPLRLQGGCRRRWASPGSWRQSKRLKAIKTILNTKKDHSNELFSQLPPMTQQKIQNITTLDHQLYQNVSRDYYIEKWNNFVPALKPNQAASYVPPTSYHPQGYLNPYQDPVIQNALLRPPIRPGDRSISNSSANRYGHQQSCWNRAAVACASCCKWSRGQCWDWPPCRFCHHGSPIQKPASLTSWG